MRLAVTAIPFERFEKQLENMSRTIAARCETRALPCLINAEFSPGRFRNIHNGASASPSHALLLQVLSRQQLQSTLFWHGLKKDVSAAETLLASWASLPRAELGHE